MKTKAVTFVICLFIFLGLKQAAFGYSVSAQEAEQPKSSLKPYLVVVVDAKGNQIGEQKGVSEKSDPFLITQELGVGPYPEDRFSAFPEIRMGTGSKITLYRAPEYNIKDGKKEFVFRSWQKTVGGLLDEKKIELGQDDKINFSKDSELSTENNIVIIRVAMTIIVEKKVIDYKIKKKDDPNLDKGTTKIEKAGEKGSRDLYYLVIREDGEEISRTLQKSEVTKQPVDQILRVGTRPVITVRCKYNDTVIEAALKYGADANAICTLMMKESNGNPRSGEGTTYQGLFQYTEGFWKIASSKAGFSGASIFDPRAQIFSTAWAVTHGERGRWP